MTIYRRCVEEAAKKICHEAHLIHFPDPEVWRDGELEGKVAVYWTHWIPAAEAALSAILSVLKEPDEAMMRAVNDGWPYPDPTPVWQAMLGTIKAE